MGTQSPNAVLIKEVDFSLEVKPLRVITASIHLALPVVGKEPELKWDQSHAKIGSPKTHTLVWICAELIKFPTLMGSVCGGWYEG